MDLRSAQACLLVATLYLQLAEQNMKTWWQCTAKTFDSVADSQATRLKMMQQAETFTLKSTWCFIHTSGSVWALVGTTDNRLFGDIRCSPGHQDPAGGGGSSSSSNTAGTQVYPFRQWVEDDFGGGASGGGGGGSTFHPLG
jgi:uncharacterized membrane protein YgcG